jgi:hypothetical protein
VERDKKPRGEREKKKESRGKSGGREGRGKLEGGREDL